MTEDALDRAVARTRSERHEARARVARACFKAHAIPYAAVNLGLFGIWLATSLSGGGDTHPWFVYPLFGWGIGLLAHWLAVRPAFRHRG